MHRIRHSQPKFHYSSVRKYICLSISAVVVYGSRSYRSEAGNEEQNAGRQVAFLPGIHLAQHPASIRECQYMIDLKIVKQVKGSGKCQDQSECAQKPRWKTLTRCSAVGKAAENVKLLRIKVLLQRQFPVDDFPYVRPKFKVLDPISHRTTEAAAFVRRRHTSREVRFSPWPNLAASSPRRIKN